jgi:phosphoinositide-3-kinase regulatory subunit 4
MTAEGTVGAPTGFISNSCVFSANDVLLSHMITFLNDKEDAQLRDSFYENIVGVATYVGWQCSLILLPLLQQVCISSCSPSAHF